MEDYALCGVLWWLALIGLGNHAFANCDMPEGARLT